MRQNVITLGLLQHYMRRPFSPGATMAMLALLLLGAHLLFIPRFHRQTVDALLVLVMAPLFALLRERTGRLHWLIFIHLLLLYFIVCRPAPSRRLRPPGRRRRRARGARRSVQHREPTVPPDRSRGATGPAGPREPGGHDRDRSRWRGRSRVIPLTAAAAGMALVPSGTVPPRRPEPVAAGSAAPIRRGGPGSGARPPEPGGGTGCRAVVQTTERRRDVVAGALLTCDVASALRAQRVEER